MERPYLVLWFAIAFFLVLVAWGIYARMIRPPATPVAQPATQPLVERLREERQRRMEPPTTVPATTTTAPADL